MTAEADKNRYWEIVVDCLVEVFGMAAVEARRRAHDLRRRVSSLPAPSLFYHAEPLDVASDLADQPAEPSRVAQRYQAILQRRGWLPTRMPDTVLPHSRRRTNK